MKTMMRRLDTLTSDTLDAAMDALTMQDVEAWCDAPAGGIPSHY